MLGFDYSAGRIAPAALLAAGCTTVFRYVSTPGNPKNITVSELAELEAAGIGVGLVYETTATWMLGGYNAGVAAAKSARAQATAAGYGPGARIWYAADFDATPAQVATIIDCLHGCADAEGSASLVSLYGGLAAIKAAANAGFTAPWQTVAWSGGVWDSRAMIRQTGKQQTVGGVSVDINTITTADLGQWTGVDMTPEQAAQLANINAVLCLGGASTGMTPPGATSNSFISKLDYLVGETAAQGAALTVVEGELKTSEPITVDAVALAAALAANTVFVTGVAAAVVAQIGADLKGDG